MMSFKCDKKQASTNIITSGVSNYITVSLAVLSSSDKHCSHEIND